MFDECLHEWEDITIVSGCSQNELAVAESIFDSFGHVITGKVSNCDFRASKGSQFICKELNGFLSIAVNRCVSDDNAFALNTVAGPCIVEIKIIAKILFEDRAMECTDGLDIKTGCFLQERLSLNTIFADDTEIVTASFACPVFFDIKGTELAEGIC